MNRVVILPLQFLVILLLTHGASAAIISGYHETDGGKVANLGGLEWHSLTETTNLNRIEMTAEFGPGGTFEGWRYATRAEVGALFDSVWGGTVDGWSVSNLDGGTWLVENFGDILAGPAGGANFHFGSDAEVGAGQSFYGHFRGGDAEIRGWLHDHWGLTTGIDGSDTQADVSSLQEGAEWGHMLVRSATVPEPSSYLILMGLIACVGLATWTRCRKSA